MKYDIDGHIWWAPMRKPNGRWVCFKDSPSTPPPPDYAAAAQQTAAGNLEAARAQSAANRVNQVTPYGSLTYSKSPRGFDQAGYDTAMSDFNKRFSDYNAPRPAPSASGDPFAAMFANGPFGLGSGYAQPSGPAPTAPDRSSFYTGSPDDGWTVTQSLAPAQQQLLDQQNKTSLGLARLADRGLGYVDQALSNNITMNDLPASMVNAGQTGQDALMARFQPQIEQSRKALETQLANQGIVQGSEAYDNAMRTQSQSENDLRMQAALNGINVGQNAQNQQLSLRTALQNQPVNMLNAVRTGSQVTNPTFTNVPMQGQTAGPDMLGAAQGQNQYNMGLYNSQVASNNAGMGLMGTLAGTGAVAF